MFEKAGSAVLPWRLILGRGVEVAVDCSGTRGKTQVDLAFVLPALWGGGVERVYLDLAKRFVQEGFCVDLVLAKAEGPMLPLVPPGVRVIDLNVPRRLRLVRALLPLERYFRSVAPRVVIPVMGYLDYLPLWAAWKAGLPTLWVLHNMPEYLLDVSGAKRWVSLWAARKALRESLSRTKARVGAVSRGVAEAFAHFAEVKVERIRVLPNSIDVDRVRSLSQEALNDLPFGKEEPFLVAVGRLHPQKGFDLLLRAFALLKKRGFVRLPYLLFLGEGPLRLPLESLAKELDIRDRVFFLGHVRNPYAYLSRSVGLVVSSRYEGLPTAVLEALALGVPVVAAHAKGGLLEAMANGRMGILCPRTPEGLAWGIERLLMEGFCVEKAQVEEHLERYSPKTAFRAYLSLLEELWE